MQAFFVCQEANPICIIQTAQIAILLHVGMMIAITCSAMICLLQAEKDKISATMKGRKLTDEHKL